MAASQTPEAAGTADVSPLFESHKVGDIDVVTLRDGHRTFPVTDDYILNASRAEINAALVAAGMPPNQFTIVFNPMVMRTPDGWVLFDTGNGPAAHGATTGLLMASLAAAGISPADIVRVVISHCHSDHINGLLTADGSPAFPNASIFVPAREWSFWNDEAERDRAPPGRMQELFANTQRVFGPLRDRIETYSGGDDVAPGVMAIDTPGHSIGHMSFIVASGGERLFVQSDVTNHPALFACNPGWKARFDQDPDMAVATRRKIYEMLADEKLLVQGFHFPFPSRGYVRRTGDGYLVVPSY
jgi:glyoxylase-like metal-dependent hydrolase (beta-lactamase superfamily II)